MRQLNKLRLPAGVEEGGGEVNVLEMLHQVPLLCAGLAVAKHDAFLIELLTIY